MDHITSIMNLRFHLFSNQKKLNIHSTKEMKDQSLWKDYWDRKIPNKTPMRNSTIGDHLLGTWMIRMMMTMIMDPLGEDHPITLGIMGEDGTLKVLDCYDVSVQPQTRPRSSLTFVRRYTPFVAYTPKPHGHNLCATISLLVLSYCLYVFCVDCSYLWATGHASYCSDHVYRCDERGGERSSRFYRPLTRCARYANYVYISRFYRPLTCCASLTGYEPLFHT